MTLLKGARVYLISNILNAVIPFLLIPVLTHHLSPSEYGQIAMFQILLAGIGTFIGLNSVGAANRKYYDGDMNETMLKEFNGCCFQILGISSVIALTIIILLQQELSEILSIPSSWIFAAVGISVFGFVSNIRYGQWQIRSEAKKFGLLQVISSLINMLLSLLLVIVLSQGAEGRIDAQIITSVIIGIMALFFLYKDNLLKLRVWNPGYIKEALAFGIPLIPHHVGFFLISAVDRFVINDKLGLAEAGIYMVAIQLSYAMAIVFDALNKAYVPWLFERLKQDNLQEKKMIVKYTYIYFVLVLVLAGLSFVIAPFLITLIVGEKYQGAGEIIGWLCLGQAFSGMYLMVTNYIFYAKKTEQLALVTISTGVLHLALLIVFVNKFGIIGAAFSFSFSKLIQFIMTWFLSNRSVMMPWFFWVKS